MEMEREERREMERGGEERGAGRRGTAHDGDDWREHEAKDWRGKEVHGVAGRVRAFRAEGIEMEGEDLGRGAGYSVHMKGYSISMWQQLCELHMQGGADKNLLWIRRWGGSG
eukprot:746889-Hanusia_phi.AAC.1